MPKKTITITELIKLLQRIQRAFGNKPVYLQQDTEGNGYGTIDKIISLRAEYGDTNSNEARAIIIQPCEEGLDIEEII